MQYIDQGPEGFYKHSTGGEHAVKHSMDPAQIEAIRQSTIEPAPTPWDLEHVYDIMAHESGGELLNVLEQRQPPQGDRLVGGALVRFEYPEEGARRITVLDSADIVIDEEHQQQGLGSWLLARIYRAGGYYGELTGNMSYSTDLRITNTESLIIPRPILWAMGREGFVANNDGDLTLKLPGLYRIPSVGQEEYMTQAKPAIERARFTGSIPVERSDGGVDRLVFREGSNVGYVRYGNKQVDFDETDSRSFHLRSYDVRPVSGEPFSVVADDEVLAVMALLNPPR